MAPVRRGGLAVGFFLLVVAGCNGDEPEPEYDRQAICKKHCAVLHNPECTAPDKLIFDSVAECVDSCSGAECWEDECADEMVAQFECTNDLTCERHYANYEDPLETECAETVVATSKCKYELSDSP